MSKQIGFERQVLSLSGNGLAFEDHYCDSADYGKKRNKQRRSPNDITIL